MISLFLKEIHYRNQGVNKKTYIDSNGDIYIGQPDGRLMLNTNANTDTQVTKILTSKNITSGGGGGTTIINNYGQFPTNSNVLIDCGTYLAPSENVLIDCGTY